MQADTTLAPTNAEILDLWADVVAKRRSSDDIPVVVLVRDAIAKWGAPAPASGEAELMWNAFIERYHAGLGKGVPELVNVMCSVEKLKAVYMSANMAAPPAQEARVPLKAEMIRQMKERCDDMAMRGAFVDGWASAEAAHDIGITAAQKEGNS